MRMDRLTIWVLATGLLAISLLPARAAQRVALVIGNAAYDQEVAALKNPVRDAAAVAAALRRLGFEVISGSDVDEAAFYDRIVDFDAAARDAAISLFFYAGHGMQVDGRNYLAPVDLRLETRQDLRRRAIELGAVLEVMRSEANLVILDACRNNPLAGQLARSLGSSRAVAASRGLAPVKSARGTLIAYATEPGAVAADGAGDHSPYTQALLAHIETPGLSVNDLFTRVTASVLSSTSGRQKPWTHASLSKVVRLVAPAVPVPAARDGSTSDGLAARREMLFWESVRDSEDPADFQAYLDRYPTGTYAALARNRLKALRPPPDSPAEPPAPVTVLPVSPAPATVPPAPPVPVPATATVPAPAPAEAAEPGLSRDDRRLIQLGLSEQGFDPGPADGVIGPGTRGAIRQWQTSQGREASGFLDAESVEALLEAGEKRRADLEATRLAEAERRRRQREASERARAEEEARKRAQRETDVRAMREAQERAHRKAVADARRPIGAALVRCRQPAVPGVQPSSRARRHLPFHLVGRLREEKGLGQGGADLEAGTTKGQLQGLDAKRQLQRPWNLDRVQIPSLRRSVAQRPATWPRSASVVCGGQLQGSIPLRPPARPGACCCGKRAPRTGPVAGRVACGAKTSLCGEWEKRKPNAAADKAAARPAGNPGPDSRQCIPPRRRPQFLRFAPKAPV